MYVHPCTTIRAGPLLFQFLHRPVNEEDVSLRDRGSSCRFDVGEPFQTGRDCDSVLHVGFFLVSELFWLYKL